MKEYCKKYFWDIIFLFIISLIPFLWFPEDYIVTGHDAGYPINIIETFKDRLYTWNSLESFGRDNTVNVGAIPIHAIEAAFNTLGFSLQTSQIFAFVFWFFSMLLSMHYFASTLREIIPYRLFPFIAALLYGINFYLLALWRYGAGTTFSAYIAFPLSLSILIPFLENRKNVLHAGLSLAFIFLVFNGGGGFSLPLFGGIIAASFVAIGYYFLLTPVGLRLAFLSRLVGLAILFVACSLVLNAFWLLPFIHYVLGNFSSDVAAHGGVSGIIAWTDEVSKFTSFANLFRLQGFPDWYDGSTHAYAGTLLNNPFFVIVSLLFAPLSYAALLLTNTLKQRKLLLYFVILSLVALLFSAGTHEPTKWIFVKFVEYVPGFSIFRSAQYKFIPAVYISFSLLIAFTLSKVLDKGVIKRVTKVAVMFLIVCFVLFYHFPYLGRSFFFYNKPLTTLLNVPDYVHAYDQWLQNQKGNDDRIVILPPSGESWKSGIYTWNYFSLYSLFNLITPHPYLEYSQTIGENQFAFIKRLSYEWKENGPHLATLSSLLGAPFALVRGDSYFDFPTMPSQDPSEYKAKLDSYKFPVVWQDGKWQLYTLPGYKTFGKLYTVNTTTQLIGSKSDVIAPILSGDLHFIQTNSDALMQNIASISDFPIQNVIRSSICTSCILDEEIAPPDSYTSILPGSILYGVKKLREQFRGRSEPINENERVSKLLSTAHKRAVEVQELAQRKSEVGYIEENLTVILPAWESIATIISVYQLGTGDLGLMRIVEAYAKAQKRILTQSYTASDQWSIKQKIQSIISQIDSVLIAISQQRNYWTNVIEYQVPAQVKNAELFFDLLSLSHNDKDLVIPDTMYINNKAISITPTIVNEKVSLGAFNLEDVSRIQFVFGSQKNYLVNKRVANVVGPDVENNCIVYDVDNFENFVSYRLIAHASGVLSDTVRMYIKRYKQYEVSERNNENVLFLTKNDRQLGLDRYSDVPQYFVFNPEEADVAASVFICDETKVGKLPEINDITLQKRFTPILYMRESDAAYTQSKTSKIVYKKINQTTYEVNFSDVTFPTILVFNENYNKQWKLGTSSNHFIINGYANAWYLDSSPGEKVILEYYPQRLFKHGVVITVVGIVVFGLLSLYLHKKLNTK